MITISPTTPCCCASGCGKNVAEPRKNGTQGDENQHRDGQVKIDFTTQKQMLTDTEYKRLQANSIIQLQGATDVVRSQYQAGLYVLFYLPRSKVPTQIFVVCST